MENFFLGTRAATEFEFDADAHESHSYLGPELRKILEGIRPADSLLDLGCGNGTLTAQFMEGEREIVGLEHSESGLANAREHFPRIDFRAHDLNNVLASDLRGRFDVVVSAEVIEHLYYPRELFNRAREGLKQGGILIVTTPFHGYAKNLALALSGKFDNHWRPGWDHGHIKFFSTNTLGSLSAECGFELVRWSYVGRVKSLAKSMIMIGRVSG